MISGALSRRRGFVFNNLNVDNFDGSRIYLHSVKANPITKLQYFEFEAPGRNGSLYFNNKYDNQLITVSIIFYAKTEDLRIQIKNDILSKVTSIEGYLYFLDEPEKRYKAKVYEAVSRDDDNIFTSLDITFHASWCMYGPAKIVSIPAETYNEMVDYADGDIVYDSGKYYKVKGEDLVVIGNEGNLESETIIKITANEDLDLVTVSNGSESFSLSNLDSGEEIFVDSEKMIVYSWYGPAKLSKLVKHSGSFIKVPVGDFEIEVSGSNYDVTVEVQFNDTYLY